MIPVWKIAAVLLLNSVYLYVGLLLWMRHVQGLVLQKGRAQSQKILRLRTPFVMLALPLPSLFLAYYSIVAGRSMPVLVAVGYLVSILPAVVLRIRWTGRLRELGLDRSS